MTNMFFSDNLDGKIQKLHRDTGITRYEIFMETIENYNKHFGETIKEKHPETAKYRALLTAFSDVNKKYNGNPEGNKTYETGKLRLTGT